MKLLLPLLLCCFQGYTQSTYNSSPLNDFIEQPSVRWAMYADDTTMIFQQLMKDSIMPAFGAGKEKGYVFEWDGNETPQSFKEMTLTDFIDQDFQITDSLARTRNTKYDPETIRSAMDRISGSALLIHQLLYFKDGKISSFISRVSPLFTIYQNTGGIMHPVLLNASFISFCLNKQFDLQPAPDDNILSLGSTVKMIFPDSSQRCMIKQLYHHSITDELGEQVFNNKLQAYSAITGKKIDSALRETGLLPGYDLQYGAICDDEGQLTGMMVMRNEFSFSLIVKIELKEEWYYDLTKSILFCKIPEAYLYDREIADGGYLRERKLLKVVF